MALDATWISQGLFQGGRPPTGPAVAEAGFTELILCAREFQPGARDFPGVYVVHAPNSDDLVSPPTPERLQGAIRAAGRAPACIRRGGRVLAPCRAGLNRSGLVSALTLHLLLKIPGAHAVQIVQAQRVGSLFNPRFIECLARLV
jgi:hypothetical protein